MKHKSETKIPQKDLNSREYEKEMPHISTQDTGDMHDLDEYDDYLSRHSNQQSQNTEGYDHSQQHFNYGFFDKSSLTNVYVNAKQLSCIKKRKMRRDYLDKLMVPPRNTYLHESRHRHAMKRLRAPSGRFLTKEETEEFLKNQEVDQREDL
jgi:hypothetical protein